MTLIESALRKMQIAAEKRPAQPAPPVGRANRAMPVMPTETVTAPQDFLRVALDAATMEQSGVLSPSGDQNAVRAYKILRTRVLQKMAANNWHTIAVSGTQAQQGKTVTAINLAIALSQDTHTSVYLVDMDLRRPRIAAYLGMQVASGLSDYLTGRVEADKIIYDVGIPRLAVIPQAAPLQDASELLASPRMAALMRVLASGSPQRIVVFDMPPLMLSDDVLLFAPNVDGILLVATEGQTTRASLESAKELLSEMNVLGVVLNRSAEYNDSYYY